jgi:hypothetical protein
MLNKAKQWLTTEKERLTVRDPRPPKYKATVYGFKVHKEAEDTVLYTLLFHLKREADEFKRSTEKSTMKPKVKVEALNVPEEDGWMYE